MQPISLEFVYQTMNAIASRQHDTETELSLAHAVERELVAMKFGR